MPEETGEVRVDRQAAIAAPRSKIRRWAITASVILHVGIVIALLFIYFPESSPKQLTEASVAQDRVSNSLASIQTPATQVPSPPVPEAFRPPPAPEIPSEELRASIDGQIEAAAKLTQAKQLAELEKNLEQLEKVSSPDGVREMTEVIGEKLGIDTDMYQPKQSVPEGEFDISSAQLRDVRRKQLDNGSWTYESVMVDAQGRTLTVPLTQAEGESIYSTFEQLRKFPMAESIYQSLVMPMLQEMLREK